MPIEYDFFGDPSILYARWRGTIRGTDILSYETDVIAHKAVHHTARELCDLSDVDVIDYAPEDLTRSSMLRANRVPGAGWTTLNALMVPDVRFLGFARDYKRLVTTLTQDHVQIVSEEAAALALLGRRESSIQEFLAAAGPPLPRGG